ncbi:glycerate kinase [Streptomyces sp. 3MP-14]|uniref:Glycerate kinase n=1 Tax=Streptomyces mimosae TaxID=2586635 RepID=A0A5N6A571_9ACTN|nr:MULTISPECIES: glycerate kinase [Streptomyces]KAB8162860.1 glycerate kinase [Streptomyces mimosae]KAB8179073.1 glycerate kinase [Streptomyces sp. 3MP-14]
MFPYRIVVAPSGFKESLTAAGAAEAIAAGLRRAAPAAEIDRLPLVDGGEGTAAALAAATGGRMVPVTATGPVGRPVRAELAVLGDGADREAHRGNGPPWVGGTAHGTFVVEMASVAGLALVPAGLRDPGATTTRGVGELLRAALDLGARRVLVTCGDSGTSDGGAGALQALGARLLDARGRELPPGGAALNRLERIDPARLDPRLAGTELVVACNPFNVLCGPRGVARVFGPQKGADPARVAELSSALERWAAVLARDVAPAGVALRSAAGTGASGGLGAGLAALGARLRPRFEVLLDQVGLDGRLAGADLVVTAEGALDRESSRGKVPGEVARRARALGVPVLVLAGTIGEGAHEASLVGMDAWSGILPAPVALPEALARGGEFLADAAERALRMVLLGSRLAQRSLSS